MNYEKLRRFKSSRNFSLSPGRAIHRVRLAYMGKLKFQHWVEAERAQSSSSFLEHPFPFAEGNDRSYHPKQPLQNTSFQESEPTPHLCLSISLSLCRNPASLLPCFFHNTTLFRYTTVHTPLRRCTSPSPGSAARSAVRQRYTHTHTHAENWPRLLNEASTARDGPRQPRCASIDPRVYQLRFPSESSDTEREREKGTV